MEAGFSAGWNDFLVATAGAVGALAGLVFVALSINLSKIIEFPGVASRAAETIVLLAGSLIATLLLLVPGDSPASAGTMLLVVGVPMAFGPGLVQLAHLRKGTYFKLKLAWARLALHQLSTLPIALAGLSLLGIVPGGLMWFALGIALSIALALINAWVLLVEIVR